MGAGRGGVGVVLITPPTRVMMQIIIKDKNEDLSDHFYKFSTHTERARLHLEMSSTSSFERGRFYSSNLSYTRGSLGGEQQPRPSSAEGRASMKTFQAPPSSSVVVGTARHGSLLVPNSTNHNKHSLHKITKMFRGKEGKGGSGKEKFRVPPTGDGGESSTGGGEGSGLVGGRSPEGSPNAFRRNRSYSVGSRTALKVRRGKDREEPFFMWKPVKVRERERERECIFACPHCLPLLYFLFHLFCLCVPFLSSPALSPSFSLKKKK